MMKTVIAIGNGKEYDLTPISIKLDYSKIASERNLREILHWICKNELEKYKNEK